MALAWAKQIFVGGQNCGVGKAVQIVLAWNVQRRIHNARFRGWFHYALCPFPEEIG